SDTLWPQHAALSYCWEGDQEVNLTKPILTLWRSEILFYNLPQTIKDALWVTAELGLQYLWVDAFCIIQDEDADKNKELARMSDVYSEAYITLLAARSPKGQDGFLQ
ncbi:hypothetical protein BU25DRAFT_297426, partial [Macroventuria anomochaeta]